MSKQELEQRRYPARIGITALNLIVPGLGLLRVGRWRAGLAFLCIPFLLIALLTVGALYLPITGYGHATIALVALLVTLAAMIIVPAAITWRASRYRGRRPAWSRWFALAAVAIGTLAALQVAEQLSRGFVRPFFVPSENMVPTLQIGDRFVVDMQRRGTFHRGEIVLVDAPGGVRVNRVVGLPGERVAVRAGVPIVTGRAVVQVVQAAHDAQNGGRAENITLLTEQLPGAPSRHQVINEAATPADNMPVTAVPAGHLFLLGDHRDRSADSRMTVEQNGLGMVPFSAVIGRPCYIYWSHDRARVGTFLDAPSRAE